LSKLKICKFVKNKNMSILFKTAPVGELLDADEKAGIVKGYGSYFGNKDSDNDVIVKGAYKKTIEENGERVKYLYQHDMFKPIGKMVELYEDDKGLVFVAEVAKTQLGMDTIELMKAGVITENSVGIMPIQKQQKGEIREISEVKLYEISAVTIAANDQAKILDVKNEALTKQHCERFEKLAKLIRKGNISDEMGLSIEAELLKLKSLFEQFTTPVEETTLPKNEVDAAEPFNYMLNLLQKI